MPTQLSKPSLVRVYAPGVFDLFHIGHLNFLRNAAAYGDLIVGIQDDRSVEKQKGSLPTIPLQERIEILGSLQMVSKVVSYVDINQSKVLATIKPNIFACSESYGGCDDHRKTLEYCDSVGIRVVRIPYTTEISSTLIKSRIRQFWSTRRPAMLTSFGGEQTAIDKETRKETQFVCDNKGTSQRLLDLGCGDGRLVFGLKDDFVEIVGVDFSAPMIESARNMFIEDHIRFECCDVLDFKPSSNFDVALLSGLIVYQDDHCLRRLITMLDSYIDNRLIIRNPIGLNRRVDIIDQVSPNFDEPYTAYYRTIGELVRMFSKNWVMTEAIELYRHHEDTAIWGMVFEKSNIGQ